MGSARIARSRGDGRRWRRWIDGYGPAHRTADMRMVYIRQNAEGVLLACEWLERERQRLLRHAYEGDDLGRAIAAADEALIAMNGEGYTRPCNPPADPDLDRSRVLEPGQLFSAAHISP